MRIAGQTECRHPYQPCPRATLDSCAAVAAGAAGQVVDMTDSDPNHHAHLAFAFDLQ